MPDNRVFLAKAKLILARVFFTFDMEPSQLAEKDWMDQAAFLVFEPSPLVAHIKERAI